MGQAFQKLKNQQMTIVYLLNQFYLHGGIERITASKINYFSKEKKYKVILITSSHLNKKMIYDFDDTVIHQDLSINYDNHQSYFSFKNLLKTFLHYFKLKKAISKIQPNVIISAGVGPEQYFLPYIYKKIPKIKELHSTGEILKLKGFKKILFNLQKHYNRVIVLNDDEKKYYPNFPTEVIPNFVNIKTSSKEFLRENVIIVAGRIAPVKQFDHLIKAWAMISNDFPDWKIKIFGDGSAEFFENLQEIALRLGVSKSVIFEGATDDLMLEMQKAKIYALTSENECFPMVILEAQANGLAVISYDCPNGPRNIIQHENGILIENQNINKFAKALAETIRDDEKIKILSKNAVQNVERFGSEIVMKKWNSLLHQLQNE